MRIRILPSAIKDLSDGYIFYENQVFELGSYFLETLFSDIDSLKLYAGIHPKVFGYHRILSKRFPFAIYYKIEYETILVNAVLDCRRNPEWIREKLKKSE
jgi:hypothetical protein